MSYSIYIYFDPCSTFGLWFSGEDVSAKAIFVGGIANVVFGFIDNAGLFFGGCYLDEIFE